MLKLSEQQHPLMWLLGSLLAVMLCLLAACLVLNDGQFFYTLDDPYIHLALAERIGRGHYGINDGEFASPSSSVLWPFLLVLPAYFPWGHLVPLMANMGLCLATAALAYRAFCYVYSAVLAAWATFGLLVATGTLALVFTGMEHSLQLLLTVAIISAMIDLTERRALPRWLMAALIMAPLVRYEMLGVSLGAVVLLMLYRRFQFAWALVEIGLLLGGFSLVLWWQSGELLPSSVMAKYFYSGSWDNTLPMLAALAMLGWFGFMLRKEKRQILLIVYTACIIIAQLLFGKTGWFSRYEVYAFAAGVFMVLYYLPRLGGRRLKHPINATLAAILVLTICNIYLKTTISIPHASHEIFGQQGQLRRLLEETGMPDAAVNDIGLASYKNRSYVLDLWGLVQPEVRYRRIVKDHDILELVAQHNIKLVMMYRRLYPAEIIPPQWVLLGTLEHPVDEFFLSPLGGKQVDIYATTLKEAQAFRPALRRWREGLPDSRRWQAERVSPNPYKN